MNGKYQTCTGPCSWQNAGTDADNDGVDKQCGDLTCDNANGVCDTAVAGKCIAKTIAEIICNDGLDNDCDGLTDCSDPDCSGSIIGVVANQYSNGIASADVSAKKDLTTFVSSTANSQGSYSISSILCGAYNLVASHPDYLSQAKSVSVPPKQQLSINFNLILGTSCESDCTFAADNIVHASCDTKSGCSFCDSVSKSACDNSQPGWLRDYNATHFVTCPSGCAQPKVEIKSSITCESGTLVKVYRIVTYNGQPVKLIVAVCG